MVFEDDVFESAGLMSAGGGEVLVEEDVLDDENACLLVESCEWVVARRRRRQRSASKVDACLHGPQEAGVHHHVGMAVRLGLMKE